MDVAIDRAAVRVRDGDRARRRKDRSTLLRSSLIRRRALTLAVLAAPLGLSGRNALAVDRTWLTAGGGSFTVAANWSGGVIPGAVDRPIFDLSSSAGYTVFFPVTVVTDKL